MVTGNAQVALVAEALKGGAVSYVPKPVDLSGPSNRTEEASEVTN